ncbi:MAG: DUF5123 domain-containing protein [Paludibacter sp.]
MKSKYIKFIYAGLFTVIAAISLVSCDNYEFPVDASFKRLFSSVTFETATVTATSVKLTFSKVSEATAYVIEFSEDSLQFTNIAKTVKVSIDTLTADAGTTNKYSLVVTNLKGGMRYSARLKSVTVAANVPESKYDMVTFLTKSEQIFKGIITTEKTDISVILHWDATGADVSHIVLTSLTDATSITYQLTDADKKASLKLFDGLKGSTTYTASIFNSDNKRGELTFRTNESVPSTGVIIRLTGTEDIYTVLKDLSGDITLVMPIGSTFVATWFDPVLATTSTTLPLNDNITSLTFWGVEGGTQAKLNATSVKMGAGITKIKLKNIEYTGNVYTADYFINESVTRALSEVTFDNCNIHTVRGIVRMQNDANYTVLEKVSFTGCIIHDLGSYGLTSTAAANIKMNNLEVRECTFYNMTDALGNMKSSAASIIIDACTFYNCFGNGKYIFNFNVTFLPVSFSISNSIFGKINATVFDGTQSMRATSPKMTTQFMFDYYKTTDCLVNVGYPMTGVNEYMKSSTDIFTDPANNNFTLKDKDFSGYSTAGDPRWRQ